MSIIIRNDDVLLTSKERFEVDFRRFKSVHQIICSCPKLKHVPAILTDDLRNLPEATTYLQEETAQGRMFPELHGLRHVDYGALTEMAVIDELAEAVGWFRATFGYEPKKWYTPWGASQPHLHRAAAALNMVAVDCSGPIKFKGRYGVYQMLKDNTPLEKFEGREIIMHWWDFLDRERLAKFAQVLNEAHTPD